MVTIYIVDGDGPKVLPKQGISNRISKSINLQKTGNGQRPVQPNTTVKTTQIASNGQQPNPTVTARPFGRNGNRITPKATAKQTVLNKQQNAIQGRNAAKLKVVGKFSNLKK